MAPSIDGTSTRSARSAFISPEARDLLAKLQLALANKPVAATVTRITTITPAERVALLEQRLEQPMPTATRQALEQMLNSPDLRHAELKVNQRTAQILTTLPLNAGQVLAVKVRPDGQLQLLTANMPSLSATPTAIQNATSALEQRINTAKPDAPPQALQKSNPPPVTNTHSASTHSQHTRATIQEGLMNTLREALTRVLPQAEKPSSLLNTALKITELSSASDNRQVLTQPLLRPLQNLLQHTVTLDQWQKAPVQALKAAMMASGVLHENRLASAQTSSEALAVDHKVLLTQLLAQLPSIQGPIYRLPTGNSLDQLLMNLLGGRASNTTSTSQQTQLVQESLQHLVQSSLARVQLNQYKAANSVLVEGSTIQHTYLDIPLRTPDGFVNIYVHLQEPREKPAQKEEEKKGRQKPKWRVYLELELSAKESVAVEIGVMDNQVDVMFWAEDPQLRQRIQAGLKDLKQDLEEQDLAVGDLRCSQNAPPEQSMKLDYALIDVRT